LRGTPTGVPASPVSTIIPYLPMKDFANEVHYKTTKTGYFSSWTFMPSFTIPTNYAYVMRLGPPEAFNGATQYSLAFYYHAVNFAPIALGANNYFPTPDQFDSMIVDLAIAEIRNVYRLSNTEQEYQLAMQSIADAVDTYRTDRYDLAGLTDQMAQSQEKQLEKAK
jgi:hypothetical protein